MLAILGGQPIRQKPWPAWPLSSEEAIEQLAEVLNSQRWTIRGWFTGRASKQTEFANRFARFNKAKHCIMVSSGSASLVVALEALNVGFRDEVIIPVYTWIATAIGVININAVPIFVDVDATGCLDPKAVEAAITPRTRVIIPVHLHCAIADMTAIMTIAKKHDLYVIEDCAQAHGARINNHYVGTLGHIGAFSMNQEKILNCGEGGALLTNDDNIANRIGRLRADGSQTVSISPKIGEYELVDVGGLMGSNYCMSDFQAAVLMGELNYLEKRNRHRERNAIYLNEKLTQLGGLTPIPSASGTTARTYFKYAIRRDPEAFEGVPTHLLAEALSSELGFKVEQTECKPLHQNMLYCPETKRRHHLDQEYLDKLDVSQLHFPMAEAHYENTFTFHHRILLGEQSDMDDIIEAFAKVQSQADSLL